ncbi:MAG: serine protease [Acidobacteriota bacterium]|nr:serine protease [Acidobacteriota bacterium]
MSIRVDFPPTMKSSKFAAYLIYVLSALIPSADPQTQGPSVNGLFEQTKAASVVILSGDGMGRLRSIATGFLISKDGLILAAWHTIKGSNEVQIRTATGEVFDRVQLLGVDERRDVVELRITSTNLPFLRTEALSQAKQGDAVYTISNSGGLTWSASNGMVSAIRMADEVPGLGTGFRVIQFNAPVASGASGAPLVMQDGGAIGIITASASGAGIAVPVESVLGLAEGGRSLFLASGKLLELPRDEAHKVPSSSTAIAEEKPANLIESAKTIYLHSKTSFLTVDTLERALLNDKRWTSLGLTIVGDQKLADLIVEVDRPLFTYVHTFVLSDRRTSIVLGSGKVTAFDGTLASGGLAKEIESILAKSRIKAEQKEADHK